MSVKDTPLLAEHEALSATLVDFAGWRMPLRYSGDLVEHQAVRTHGGLFDLSHMGEIEVSGPGAGEALDVAVVGRMSNLEIGRARYTMLCRDDGGILDDLIVYRTGDDRFLIVPNAANAALVLDELTTRTTSFDATVTDTRDDWALLALQGPLAEQVLSALTDTDLTACRYYSIVAGEVAGYPVQLARTGYTGEDGFELFCSPTEAPAIWRALLEAGSPVGVLPCGLACRDSLRLEAGMPLYGHELSTAVTPYEAGLGRVVALDKPDFVGKAALAARAESGPQRSLIGLRVDGRRAARAEHPVLDPATGGEIGEVTSGLPSPSLGFPIAMAYVPTDRAEPGTELAVSIRGTTVSATVVPKPFYRRDR